jgi:hypothetical protein
MRLLACLLVLVGIVCAQACSPRTAAQPTGVPQLPASTPTYTPTNLPPTEAPVGQEVAPTSIEDISGIWDSRMLSERGYHEFRPDGTLILGYTIDQLKSARCSRNR